MRKIDFVIGEYYHIYNRGVDKRDVFLDENDYSRFLVSMREFNQVNPIGSIFEKKEKGSSTSLEVELPKLVEVVCYCLNPNHPHLILKQLEYKGIEKFMHRLDTGYTKYFNRKNNRSGALFQGRYKAIYIDSNEYLLYLSAYVNCNSEVHKIANAENYKWCSFPDYIGKRDIKICEKNIILGQFGNFEEYKNMLKLMLKK
jgi:putative transposase